MWLTEGIIDVCDYLCSGLRTVRKYPWSWTTNLGICCPLKGENGTSAPKVLSCCYHSCTSCPWMRSPITDPSPVCDMLGVALSLSVLASWRDFLEEPETHAQVLSPPLSPTAPRSSSWMDPRPGSFALPAGLQLVDGSHQAPSTHVWWGSALVGEGAAHASVPSAPMGSSYLTITPDPAAAPEAVFSASVGSGSWPLCNDLFESPAPSLIGRSRSLWWFDKSKIDEGHFAVIIRLTRNICLIYWHLVPSMGRRICPGMWHI